MNQQDTGEKTEKPLPEALRKARREGDVAHSRELSAAVALVAGVAALAWRGPEFLNRVMELMRSTIAAATDSSLPFDAAMAKVWQNAGQAALALLPALVAATVAGALAAFCQVGPLLTFRTVRINPANLNPAARAKQIWGPAALFEGFKSVTKIAVLGAAGYLAVRAALPRALRLSNVPVQGYFAEVGQIVLPVILYAAAAFLGFGAIDLLVQRIRFAKRNRVSVQGLKEQIKEYDGDPEMRHQQREKGRQIALGPMLADAELGHIGVANPTHVFCILRLDPGKENAPRLLAKGRGRLAKKLKAIAIRKGMYIDYNRPLAWALLDVDLRREIPIALYEAAAEVVRFAADEYRQIGETPPWELAAAKADPDPADQPL